MPETRTVWCCLYEEYVELPTGKCDAWCDFDCDARCPCPSNDSNSQ